MGFTSLSRRHNRVVYRIAGDKYRPFIDLYQAWKGIVGELLASRSHPFRFYNSILYVAVQNNAWLQELVLNKTEILRQCRTQTKAEVKDLVFKIRTGR